MYKNAKKIRKRAGRLARQSQRLIAALIVCALVSMSFLNAAFAAEGDLDPSFGAGGKVTTSFSADGGAAAAIAIQEDGRIVAAGSENLDDSPGNFVLARYETNGSLDYNFGTGGIVITDFSGDFDYAHAIAIQEDGLIVVAGVTGINGADPDFALARYNPDGSLDDNFGTGGQVATDFFGQYDQANGIALQEDGRIVVAGSAFVNGNRNFALARYETDGSLDDSFGAGGKVVVDFSGKADSANAVAIQEDERIVAAGVTFDGLVGDFALARFTPGGSLDDNFGTGGQVTTDFAGESDFAAAVVIQEDSRIVVAGKAVFGFPNSDFALARYNPDGSPDNNFGTAGKVNTDFLGQSDEAFSLALQEDGRIVAAGDVTVNNKRNFALVRYDTNGSLDNNFGAGGKVNTDFFGEEDVASGVAIQEDGRIVLAGKATDSNGAVSMALARYYGDSPAVVYDICVQDDGNGNTLRFSSTTGDYLFTQCSTGLTFGGTGTVSINGSAISLQHNPPDRRVLVKVDDSAKKATASVQVFSLQTTFTLKDRNTGNNTCVCP